VEFRVHINELKKIDYLISIGLYIDRTQFFKESERYGKQICEKELRDIETFKKINHL